MLENLLTLEDARVVRLLQRNEAAPARELDNEAMRDVPKVRGDLWVSRLNAEPEADIINEIKKKKRQQMGLYTSSRQEERERERERPSAEEKTRAKEERKKKML